MPVRVELSEDNESPFMHSPSYMQNSPPKSNIANMSLNSNYPQQHQQQQAPLSQQQQQQQSQQGQQQQPTSSNNLNQSTSANGFQKRPSLGNHRSRFLFSDPFVGQSGAPTGASAANLPQSTPNPQQPSQPTQPQQQQLQQQQQPTTSASGQQGLSNVLDNLTSPLMGPNGQNLMLLESQTEFDQMVRPWSSNSVNMNGNPVPASTSSKPLPEQLAINTSLASGNNAPIPAGIPTPLGSDWDRRRQFFPSNGQPPHSASAGGPLHNMMLNGPNAPSMTSPTFQNQPSIQQQLQQQQQQQQIPELSLLARVPPPANPADQNPPCNTLYVGNLPPDATETELRALFQPQKGFRRLSFRTKQNSGNGNNAHHGPMCFVEFEDVAHATRALAELYGRTLPRANGNNSNNNKGGIRLSFSKNPLGVRGPGQNRRSSNNPQQQYNNNNNNNNNQSSVNVSGNGNVAQGSQQQQQPQQPVGGANGNLIGNGNQAAGLNPQGSFPGFNNQFNYQQMTPLSQYPK
ncbi:unnamed protein product [Ambrosiozyma monospora]|uniref:Unnamed protein product n=1 Tax=Ambrosiozyma monospora TaxID=43982 RepID=A0A9W6YLH5_AMBMO|nr:unnamed protein product [Ambrosiozyma monospora]